MIDRHAQKRLLDMHLKNEYRVLSFPLGGDCQLSISVVIK